MQETTLEHTNVTVTDPVATAAWLEDVFGWHIRWHGPSKNGGETYHVGAKGSYIALYRPKGTVVAPQDSYQTRGGLNHIAVVVPDLDATESRVKAAGFVPQNHADYEPGRRFYFDDADGIEWEVVSYV